MSVFAFMRGSRGGIGGPELLENHNVEDFKKELLSESRSWKFPGSAHGFAFETNHGSI